MIPNLKEHEFDYLYEQLTSVSLYVYEYYDSLQNPSVNMKEDWKILSVLIGFNDLCLG